MVNHSKSAPLILAILILTVASCGRPQIVLFTPTPSPVATESPDTGCDGSGCIGDITIRQVDGMPMVYVPAGEFEMGSKGEEVDDALRECNEYSASCRWDWFADEQPSHTVALGGFWIDQTEVSNAQYRQCVEEGMCEAPTRCDDGEPTYDDPSKADHPAVCVDWHAAVTYCEWTKARLPTEAEWEYAARGPDRRRYPWGEQLDGERLNLCDEECELEWADGEINDGHSSIAPVGSYPAGASWCGALDLAGNVWEWVADWYAEYPSERQVDPTGPAHMTSNRVIRGGSWVNTRIYVRAALRMFESPGGRDTTCGFRCARSSSP